MIVEVVLVRFLLVLIVLAWIQEVIPEQLLWNQIYYERRIFIDLNGGTANGDINLYLKRFDIVKPTVVKIIKFPYN